MKPFLHILFLLLPLLAISQERTITDEKSQLVLSDGIYYEVITTEYETGPPLIVPVKIGGSAATLSYLQARAVNRQQEVARAQRKVIEEKTLGFRQFLGLDTLVKDITGGDTTLFQLNNYTYFPELEGRYRIRNQTGSTNFTAQLILYPNGAVRFQREDDPAVTYPVLIYSPINFAVLALPVGALPASRYDLVEISPTATGLRVWRDELRILTIIKLE